MSEQKYKDEIKQLPKQLKTEKKENESLKTKIRVRGQELGFRSEELRNETALRGAIHDSRKRERSNADGVFMPHQRGPITSTFTVDWFLREGQGRELLGEWMKFNHG